MAATSTTVMGLLGIVRLLDGRGVGEAAGEDVEGVQDGLVLIDRDGVEQRRHVGAARTGEASGGSSTGVGEDELDGALIVRVALAQQPPALDQHVGEAANDAAIQPQAPRQLGLGERLRGELGQRVGMRDADRLAAWRPLWLVETERSDERLDSLLEVVDRRHRCRLHRLV